MCDSPGGRYGHRAIANNGKMILFGGFNGKKRLSDTLEFDLGMVLVKSVVYIH